ncbi:MAG TPA: hypothetical protein VK034_12440, partial [Enhygromyxa sp.]|nr:hypothetical protein [Enhygromyxa sp.]
MSVDVPLPKGWILANLRSLLREPMRNGKSGKATETGAGLRTLTLTAVTKAEFTDQNTKLTVTTPADADGLWLEAGDILVQRSNTPELVGTAALYRGPENWAIFPDLLIRVRLFADLSAPYIEAWLRCPSMRKYFRGAARGSAGSMPKISQDTVADAPVRLAPASEQRRIVAEIEKQFTRLDAAVATLKRVQANLERARASVLKAAVEGRLVPTEAELARAEGRVYEPASVLLERIDTPPRPSRWKSRSLEVIPGHAALAVNNPRTPLPEGWQWALLADIARLESGHTPSRRHPEWWDGDI